MHRLHSWGWRSPSRGTPGRVLYRSAGWLVLMILTACTNVSLKRPPGDPPPVFDDKLQVSGEVCTTDPAELQAPLKVLFVIDTSQSMDVNDPVDPSEPNITQATNRNRAVREIINRFIRLDVQFSPTTCFTEGMNCSPGDMACPACQALAPSQCVGPRCCTDTNPLNCIAIGLPQCQTDPMMNFVDNGTCLQMCDNTSPGCLPGEIGCPQCQNVGDVCINGVCGTDIDPGVEFAIMRFGAAKEVLTRDADGDFGFTRNPGQLLAALANLTQGTGVTDYEGTLTEIFSLLSNDIRKAKLRDAAALELTRYQVIFLTDGQPDPAVTTAEDWDIVAPSIQQALVNGDPGGDITIFNTYNVASTILDKVRDIIGLRALHSLAEIKFHTIFFADGTPASEHDKIIPLLEQMRLVGNGTFRNVQNGEDLSFLHIDLTSLNRVFRLKNFIASNQNGLVSGSTTVLDSDADGLSDELELTLGTSPILPDTDGDGFSDSLEYFLRTSGADPLDDTDADCSLVTNDIDGDGLRDDSDGDGLLDCEERFIGSGRTVVDTDGDGIPDQVEQKFITNPSNPDANLDLDFDGLPNGDEIRLHTDPKVDDAANRSRVSYRYNVTRTGSGIEQEPITCTADADCPSGLNCQTGICRCAADSECSSQTACVATTDCPTGETCVNSVCSSDAAICVAPETVGENNLCVKKRHITCYSYSVENITLVQPLAAQSFTQDGWNNIYLYFGEVPFDSPDSRGRFKIACVQARYNSSNGAKLPAVGQLALPKSAFKDPTQFNPQTDCVCPDGTQGDCPNKALGGGPGPTPDAGP